MAQAITPSMSEGRRQALERRRAQAQKGRATPSARPASAQSVARPSVAASSGGQAQTQAAKSVPQQQRQRSAPATTFSTGRAASVARRQAMTSRGKVGIAVGSDSERTRAETVRARPIERKADKDSCGCGGRKEEGKEVRGASVPANNGGMSLSSARPAPKVKAAPPRRNIGQPEGRQLSKARRRMLAEKGRTALSQTERVRSPAERARHLNPDLNGRELAREVRSERSRSGDRGRKSSAPSGRQRPAAGASDAPWKVGSSQTAQGQTVTGTQVARGQRLTGDETNSCRVITGTEYLAADIFREFCQTDMVPNPSKVSLTKTAAGLPVTGTEVGRSTKVTGNEAGNCTRVTGNEYLPADQISEFCGISPQAAPAKVTTTRTGSGRQVSGSNIDRPSRMTGMEAGAGRATTGTSYSSPLRPAGEKTSPVKVGVTSTLRGGQVTGTLLGRNERVTGNEPGSCRQITGDEYIGGEQYQAFCGIAPRPEAPKFGVSETIKGKVVTGTQAGRGERVTGDEPGICKTVTGTPYAGTETYREYCAPGAGATAPARGRATPGMPLTGLQQGIGGGLGAVPGNPDFPQSLDGTPWAATFSVSTPAREAQRARRLSGVTGTRYEQGHITGPFVMGEGKITGTEDFRFGGPERAAPVASSVAPMSGGAGPSGPRSNITGEGMETGLRITGDDWGRNERVTGTEGRSSIQRNPTRRGASVGPMAMMARREPQEKKPAEVAPSRVTGSSGNTEKGALITVSGGARG